MVLKVRIVDDNVGTHDDKVGHCAIKLEEPLASSTMTIERIAD